MKTHLSLKFVTDEKGNKTSVILNMKEYENLIAHLENLEDTCGSLKPEGDESEPEQRAITKAPFQKSQVREDPFYGLWKVRDDKTTAPDG